MKSTTIGITGPSSFIGRNLRRRLAELGCAPTLFHGDICDPAEVVSFVRQCELIFHFAGRNRGEPLDVFRVSAVGGANLAAAAGAIGNRHIVFPSTRYIDRFPNSPYSQGKLAVEVMLRQLAEVSGCQASVFRLSNTYGTGALPHYVSVIATFCWYEANGRGHEMPIQGDGTQVTEFAPVDSVVDRLLAAREHRNAFTFNQVDGTPLSVRQIADIIRDPVIRKDFPTIQAMVDFFAQPSPFAELTADACPQSQSGDAGILEVLAGYGVRAGQQREVKVEFNQVSFSEFAKLEGAQWFCWSCGTIAVDVYLSNGEYSQTRLLDEQHVRCIRLTPEYRYDFRNVGVAAARGVWVVER